MPYGIIQQMQKMQADKICVAVVFIPQQTYYFFTKNGVTVFNRLYLSKKEGGCIYVLHQQ